ncbi:hypothetical protein [Pararhizobium sp. PWRC1-1]|uniref:hypothetical protein n=1 Tax=Pararhizobium sp. PWRC1-1 TaxID=2804566 RepID=UPI003CF9E52B
MTFYAWTISVPGRPDMEEVTTLPELQDVLRVMDLPDTALFMQPDQLMPDRGTYSNDEGSMDEWSLTWTKLDGETEVID